MSSVTTFYQGGVNPQTRITSATMPEDPIPAGFTSWDTNGTPTTRALTAPEAAHLAALDAVRTTDTNKGSIQSKAQAALAANAAYLALAAPTNTQVVAQVDRLTRECTALIRLTLAAFDSTAGT